MRLLFTFHYASTLSQLLNEFVEQLAHLHSTMLLLYRYTPCSPCFSSLREFSLRPIDKDKGSQMNEREWTPICGYLRTGACPHLESISISNNNVGYQGIEALVEAYLSGKMSKCSHLDISGNSIGNRGAIALSRLFDNPFACTSLEYLDLSDNKIHSKGFDVFLAHFGSITHEKLQYVNWSCTPECFLPCR